MIFFQSPHHVNEVTAPVRSNPGTVTGIYYLGVQANTIWESLVGLRYQKTPIDLQSNDYLEAAGKCCSIWKCFMMGYFHLQIIIQCARVIPCMVWLSSLCQCRSNLNTGLSSSIPVYVWNKNTPQTYIDIKY